ncbi:hypothetical protein CH370_20800 [Leptospira kmetyi]|uniref:Uncharacterized protein n=2 Tax=Leptospira kmetyi TaxID=408139 RepID=A0ABX4N5X2_9LEPT|nr:hypothetical protein CH378_16135 [Leptospira kmetyi]PJZ39562.1 hypothetical protein CH370_20800 [Leptospira kmetyi]
MISFQVAVSDLVVIRHLGKVEFVSDSLESLDFFLHSNSNFSLRTNPPDRFFPSATETFDFENDFWDCECEDDFIHLKSALQECPKCGSVEEEQPNSISSEVLAFGWV